MVTRIDLRVHAAAPSSRKDDERFKAQANAYGGFIPKTRHVIRPIDGSISANDGVLPSLCAEEPVSSTDLDTRKLPDRVPDDATGMHYDSTTFLEETQLGYTALESQLLAPSRHTPQTPVRRPEHAPQQGSRQSEEPKSDDRQRTPARDDESDSSHHLPSQSSYLKSPILDRSTKKPRLSEDNRRLFLTNRKSSPLYVPLREDGGLAVGFVGDATATERGTAQGEPIGLANESHSLSNNDVTSELPSTYALSDITSGSSRNKHQSVQRSVSDPGPSPLKQSSSGSGPRETHTQLPDQPVAVEAFHKQRDPTLAQKPSQAAVDADAHAKKLGPPDNTGQETPALDQETAALSALPTSIRPPPPEPSLVRFETHITDSLEYLSENPNLSKSYKPVSVARELRQSERGCWTFDIASWPMQLRVEFFAYLAKIIEPGRAGWGVWCEREVGGLVVRVFCWGEVVRHFYLLLYVASKSKVRKLGLRWVDADGEVVVQMRRVDESK